MARTWPFLIPSVMLLSLVLLWPFSYAIYLSFQDLVLGSEPRFIGIENYLDILGQRRFWSSLWTTSVIAFWSLALELALGLGLAMMLFSLKRGAHAFIVALFLPYIVTPVVSGLILKWIFMPTWGLIDATAAGFGLQSVDWFGDPFWAKVTVVLADAWVATPLVLLTLFAALQQVNTEQLEAARIDGASEGQALRYIILPAIAPMIVFVMSVRLMDLFRTFDTIYVLTGGGPGTATQTLTLLTYQTGFRQFDIGKASTLGVLTLVIVFALVLLIAKLTPRILGRST